MDGRVNAGADVGQPETLIRASYGLLASRALAWWMGGMGRYAIVAAPWRTLFSGCLCIVNRVRQPEMVQRYTNLFSGCLWL